MSFTVNSYAVSEKGGPLQPHKLERRGLYDDDVLINIIYAGVCHTDLHIAGDDYGITKFPIVPGHEIVGEVEKVGSKVTKHKVGDIVGVGCVSNSCGECRHCEASHEMYCPTYEGTYAYPETRFPGRTTAGGYSEKVVIQERCALPIPKELQDPKLISGVAPILCAGITTYCPLRANNVGKGTKVGIAGLGGLGHMGVKLAKALGAEVSVLSRSHAKDTEAKALGADKIIVWEDEKDMEANAGTLDVIVDTIPVDHDINPFVNLLEPYGGLSVVGHIGTLEKPVSSMGLIFGNKRLQGSLVGGLGETQELLELCAKNKIVADHKVITMEDVNEAWEKMDKKGDFASRFVIDIKKFRGE